MIITLDSVLAELDAVARDFAKFKETHATY